MLRKLALACGVALLGATAASASVDATATLSNSSAGARRVALTIVLRADDLRCGRLNARSLSVALPRAMRVPRSISAAAARVDGLPVASVRTEGTTVGLVPAPPKGMTCDSIGPGIVRIQLTGRAGLGNPARAGTYRFTVAATPAGVWHGSFVVGG